VGELIETNNLGVHRVITLKRMLIAIAVLMLFSMPLLGLTVRGEQIYRGLAVSREQTYSSSDFPIFSPLRIESPINTSYGANSLMLNVSTRFGEFPNSANLKFSIDSSSNETLPITLQSFDIIAMVPNPGAPPDYMSPSGTPLHGCLLTGNKSLTELSEGEHQITVYEEIIFPKLPTFFDQCTANILISDGIAPEISNLSIENKTYQQNRLPLNFYTDEATSWLGYSLDGKATITINGNTSLSNLASGSHSLTVYSNDTAGNMGSNTIFFAISEQNWLFPIVILVPSILVIAAIVVYRKKTK
jgi:hypothetical protein